MNTITKNLPFLEKTEINQPSKDLSGKTSTDHQESHWSSGLIEKYLGGILIFNAHEDLIYANQLAHEILYQLHQDSLVSQSIPEEILYICRSLNTSRTLFPKQNWLTEFDIFTNSASIIHIRSRWLNVDHIDHACLMLILEDRQKAIANIYLQEADKHGLTPREKDVWLLHHKGNTYKQIAGELGITPNTVKKHMRSIHAKTKANMER